jgi:molecular chaperone DnaK
MVKRSTKRDHEETNMRLGIDFGTTRTVVAVADRGNYPVISFQTNDGDSQQWYSSLIAARGSEVAFALDAQAQQCQPGWCFLRSLKRQLAEAGPGSPIQLGEQCISTLDLLTQYLTQLRQDLCERSNLEVTADEPLEVWIAVPANANSNQRFLTLEAFRRAGFRVLGLMNEPSAAGIEYAHRYTSKSRTSRKEYVVVYDLGGGTFDASIISMKDRAHEVLTNEGMARLGGDEFDERLLELALSRAGDLGELTETARYHLLEECREQKEGLHPNTRKIAIDLSRAIPEADEVIIPTSAFYECCTPLIEQTIAAMETAMVRSWKESGVNWDDVAAVYLVGGSSDLPIVGRMLRERYARRVRRSPYPYAATAIGLAIAADAEAGYVLQERFTRYFGVWREAEAGHRIVFDPIFSKDTPLPSATDLPLAYIRVYQPVHNVGHFRYLECSEVREDGQPSGDITPWDEIRFPLDPALRETSQLDGIDVRRADGVA